MRQKFIRTAAMAAALLIGQTLFAQGKSPEWKDRAEYDLYAAIVADQNAQSRLEKLEKWKKDYPDTQFIANRRQVYLATYQQLNKPAEVFSAAKEVLSGDPNNLQGLLAFCVYIYAFNPPSPDDMATAEKAASQLVTGIDALFAADKKPQGVTDAQWAAAKKDVLVRAQNVLGWAPFQRKEFEKAEVEMVKSLQLDGNQAEVTYRLASAIVSQKKLERLPVALFHFARAANYEGPGALTPEGRKAAATYFEKQYVNYHGDKEDIEKVIEAAKAAPLPPADWKIKSIIEREKENEEKEAAEAAKFPEKALWKDIKTALTGEGGAAYFESIKGAGLPGGAEKAGIKVMKFKGKLVSASPETNPKELIVSISGGIGDATLKLDAPLRGKMEIAGAEPIILEFDGVASSYTKEPFMLVLDVEKANVSGWAGVGGAPVPAAVKKAAPAKKAVAPVKPAPKKK